MRAVCYARTSTLDQARKEKVSIPDQVNWAKAFTIERRWEWIREYIEPGVFGDVEPEDRESLNLLLEDARNDKFDILLVYHSSRLAREPDIGMRVCRLLGLLKKQVYFRNSPIEPVPTDKFSWGSNIGAQYMTAFSLIGDLQENVARSERVRSGFQGLARRGKMPFTPYGYRKIPEIKHDENGRQIYDWHFEIEPNEALIVQKIFQKYADESGSIRSIMLALNSKDTSSPSGKVGIEAWSTAMVKSILNNPVYIKKMRWGRKLGGKYLEGKTSSGKQKRVIVSRDKWIITDGTHPRIIEDDLFNRVQEKLTIRGVLKGRAIASQGLLTGMIFCGRCNRKAYHKTSKYKKKKDYIRSNYVCQSYFRYKSCKRHIISAMKIHDIVISEIDKMARNKKFRNKLLVSTSNNKNNHLKDRLGLLKKAQEKNKTKQRKILDAYENDKLTLVEFGEAKQRLDNEVLQITKEISEIEKKLMDTSMAEIGRKKFITLLKNFKSRFTKSDFPKQKEILQSLIQSIFVKSGKIIINYRI